MVTYAYGCRVISDKILKTKKEWYGDNRKFWYGKRQEMIPPTIEYFKKIMQDGYKFGFCKCESEAGDGMIPAQFILCENNLKFSANTDKDSSICSVCVVFDDEEALLVYSCGQWIDTDGPWRKVIVDTLKEIKDKVSVRIEEEEIKKVKSLQAIDQKHRDLIEQARKLFEVK